MNGIGDDGQQARVLAGLYIELGSRESEGKPLYQSQADDKVMSLCVAAVAQMTWEPPKEKSSPVREVGSHHRSIRNASQASLRELLTFYHEYNPVSNHSIAVFSHETCMPTATKLAQLCMSKTHRTTAQDLASTTWPAPRSFAAKHDSHTVVACALRRRLAWTVAYLVETGTGPRKTLPSHSTLSRHFVSFWSPTMHATSSMTSLATSRI